MDHSRSRRQELPDRAPLDHIEIRPWDADADVGEESEFPLAEKLMFAIALLVTVFLLWLGTGSDDDNLVPVGNEVGGIASGVSPQ